MLSRNAIKPRNRNKFWVIWVWTKDEINLGKALARVMTAFPGINIFKVSSIKPIREGSKIQYFTFRIKLAEKCRDKYTALRSLLSEMNSTGIIENFVIERQV